MRKKMNKYLVKFNNIFSILVFFGLFIFVSCNERNPIIQKIYGCTDQNSCSFDPNANVYDPGSCLELDDCGICGGDNSLCNECIETIGNTACNFPDCNQFLDCLGVCGGSAVIGGCDNLCNSTLEFDECGECGGSGPIPGFDCESNPTDCGEGYIWNSGISISNQSCTPEQFLYNTSIEQAAYFFMNVTFNDQLLEQDDWVGAFNGDTCVGARKWDTSQCGGGICEVPVLGLGNEPESGYMSIGQIPTFKIFDASSQTYYEACPSEQNTWFNLATYVIDSLSEYSDNNSNCTNLVNK